MRKILLGLHVAALLSNISHEMVVPAKVLEIPEFKVSGKSLKGKGEKRRNRANRWR